MCCLYFSFSLNTNFLSYFFLSFASWNIFRIYPPIFLPTADTPIPIKKSNANAIIKLSFMILFSSLSNRWSYSNCTADSRFPLSSIP